MNDKLANAQERAIKMIETTFRQCYQDGYNEGCDCGYSKGYKDGQDIEQSNAIATKEEIAKMEYERGLNDAWECARKLILNKACGGLELDEIKKIFRNYKYPDEVIRTFSASECMAKIKEYEGNQKADEIRVGDEVDHDGLKCVVVKVWQDCICTISQVGTTPSYTDKSVLKKTGRHFDAIEELINQMRGGTSEET